MGEVSFLYYVFLHPRNISPLLTVNIISFFVWIGIFYDSKMP